MKRYSKTDALRLSTAELGRMPWSYQRAYQDYMFGRRDFLKTVMAGAAGLLLSGGYNPPSRAEAQTDPRIVQILSGADGVSIYSRTGETDTEINTLFGVGGSTPTTGGGMEPAFWRRATHVDPRWGIDTFSPSMAPGAFTPAMASSKMLTGGGGDSWLEGTYRLWLATNNADYRIAHRRAAEMAVLDDPDTTSSVCPGHPQHWLATGWPGCPIYANFSDCANGPGWAIVAIDHPTESVRTTALDICRRYAYASRSPDGGSHDIRVMTHHLLYLLTCYVMGLTSLTGVQGGNYDTATLIHRQADYLIDWRRAKITHEGTDPGHNWKGQQPDGKWYQKGDGTGGGVGPGWPEVVTTTQIKPFMDGLALHALTWYAKIFPAQDARVFPMLVRAYGPGGFYTKWETESPPGPLTYSNAATTNSPTYTYTLNGAGFPDTASRYCSLNGWHMANCAYAFHRTGDVAYRDLARLMLTASWPRTPEAGTNPAPSRVT